MMEFGALDLGPMNAPGRIAVPASEAALVRAIGLFGLTAAIVNVTVGGGIYRLPAAAARGLGPAAPLAYIACAVAFIFIVICFAEAASRVSLTGGIYAYVEIAFGPLVGLATGVLLWASCTSALAAVVSFLGDTLAALVPGLQGVFGRAVVVATVIGASAILNYRGVRLADRFNSIATMVKVAPLLILLVGGLAAIDPANLSMPDLPSFPQVAQTSAILIFAFLGVETALVPSGEVKDPERTVPRAVILAIVAVAILYLGLHLVAQGVLGAALGEQKTPLAEAAGVALGGWARQAVLGASVLSMLIYASGMMLGVPRLLFAVARDGFAPPVLAAVHPSFHTPHVAIVVQAVIVAALAISGTFERLALLGNAAALLSYGACCAAAWQLRRRDVRMTETRYDVPGGGIAPPIALLFIGWLLTGISATEWISATVVVALAVLLYATQRRRSAGATAGNLPEVNVGAEDVFGAANLSHHGRLAPAARRAAMAVDTAAGDEWRLVGGPGLRLPGPGRGPSARRGRRIHLARRGGRAVRQPVAVARGLDPLPGVRPARVRARDP